jgi:hypothetical protein
MALNTFMRSEWARLEQSRDDAVRPGAGASAPNRKCSGFSQMRSVPGASFKTLFSHQGWAGWS